MSDRYYPDFNEPEFIKVSVEEYQKMKQNLDYYITTIDKINDLMEPSLEFTEIEKQIVDLLNNLYDVLN